MPIGSQFTLLKYEDGQETIGTIDPLVNINIDGNASVSDDSRAPVRIFLDAMRDFPNSKQEGVSITPPEDLKIRARFDDNWIDSLVKVTGNTNRTLANARSSIVASLPNDSKGSILTRQMFNEFIENVTTWESLLCDRYTLKIILPELEKQKGMTEDLLNVDFSSQFKSKTDLHKTISKALRQNACFRSRSTCLEGMKACAMNRLARERLKIDPPSDLPSIVTASLVTSLTREHEKFSSAAEKTSKNLNSLCSELGIPEGTFDKDPLKYANLADFASDFQSWRDAVHRQLTGDATFHFDTGISGTGNFSIEDTTHKKKKKKKRSKKKSKAKAGTADQTVSADPTGNDTSTMGDQDTAVDQVTEDNTSTQPEEQVDEAPKASVATKQPIKLSQKTLAKYAPRKPKRHLPYGDLKSMLKKAAESTSSSS